MPNKETAKKEIENLVKKYELILKEGRIGEYNESNTRKDFILPLFSTLGWEIANINEVQEETRISRDRVDYSFNLVNIPKFYLEAKALKADLDKSEYAQQAIDYAYNKGVPWAVLTDFEKIKVFNAEWKAKTLQDSQFLEITYNEYLDRFDELWLLSKESLTQGLLDKEAERRLKKDKKQPISKQILSDLLKAREKLTKNILEHPRLNKVSEEELDESVQRILDRLIFIRTAEDRVIEQNHLLSAVRLWKEKGGNLWEKLKKIFRDFDTGYNSKLFEKHLSEDLIIDDGVLAEIIENLYQTPDGSRYDFSAISADVLGSIYEQYLGHILKKTPKSARLKETRQHRKEMGIYYTPTYIVDYIVKNTLGELLKKAKPKQAMKIRVLDPACGSGSFLIRAFDEFVNYWQKHSPGEFGYFRKIEILKNNLYGVDLDKQAVEIAQMNLLLKTLYHRERLPMLEHIKQGNSLISGSEEELKKYFGENYQSKHSFNWEKEFPEIFSLSLEGRGKGEGDSKTGFDVVIGNPPYVMVENLPEDERKFMMSKFETAIKRFDIYIAFMEKGLKLLKPGGLLSFIIPFPFLNQNYAELLRKKILSDFNLLHILDLSEIKVFGEAVVRNCVIIIEKPRKKKINKVVVRKVSSEQELQNLNNLSVKLLSLSFFSTLPKYMFRTELNEAKMDLLEKIEKKSIVVGQIYYVNWGARSGDVKKYVVQKPINRFCRKMINARNVERYQLNYTGDYLVYKKEELYNPMFEELFESPKIVVRDITGRTRLKATLDFDKYYAEHTVSLVVPYSYLQQVKRKGLLISQEETEMSRKYDLRYVLAHINSSLVNWFFISKLGGGLHVYPEDVKQFPICKIDFSDRAEKKMHDEIVKLVDRMLELNKQLQKFGDKLTDNRRRIESEIQKTDQEINELIYKLYGLSEDEIKIVEGSLE